jgi:hypothetical protein
MVCYPPNAGGKFLINCLGLSDGAVFQSEYFVKEQLSGKFGVNEKMKFLLDGIRDADTGWNDLNLGCHQLFGCMTKDHKYGCNDTIDQLSNSSKLFFVVSHHFPNIETILDVWTNAQVIVFNNYDRFVKDRGHTSFMTGQEPHFERTLFDYNKKFITWDTNWYYSRQETVHHVQELYDDFELMPVNKMYLENYYEAWSNHQLNI